MLSRQSQVLTLAARYIQYLSHPPGPAPSAPDMPAAVWLQQELSSHGVSARVHEPSPGRAHLVARLAATSAPVMERPSPPTAGRTGGSDGPLLLWAPIDQSGPVSLGRGPAAVFAALTAEAARTEMQLRRDVILALTSERAGGSCASGLAGPAENHGGEMRPAAVLTGGGWHLRLMGKTYLAYQYAELGRAVFRLVARGRPGHGCPGERHPIILLGQALTALGQWECPIHISPGFQACVEALADAQTLPASSCLRSLLNPLLTREAAARVTRDPQTRARLLAQASNTFRPTELSAACRQEGLPGSAETTIDCRLPPGQTAATARAELEDLLRARKLPVHEREGCWLEVITLEEAPAIESPPYTELTRAMERAVRRLRPSAVLVPVMDAGGTPVRFLRAQGIPAYGFFPTLQAEPRPGGRSNGESLSPRGLEFAVSILWEVLVAFAGPPGATGAESRTPAQRS